MQRILRLLSLVNLLVLYIMQRAATYSCWLFPVCLNARNALGVHAYLKSLLCTAVHQAWVAAFSLSLDMATSC